MTEIVVFDIDGTIADITHRRHWVATKPKNWAAFNAGIPLDVPYLDIVRLVRILASKFNIILCSGRGEETRAITKAWLYDNGIPFVGLYMRPAKDNRKDSIVKVELLQKIRADHGEPYIWFDDRNQVVDAIRAEGVRVLQVAEGNF